MHLMHVCSTNAERANRNMHLQRGHVSYRHPQCSGLREQCAVCGVGSITFMLLALFVLSKPFRSSVHRPPFFHAPAMRAHLLVRTPAARRPPRAALCRQRPPLLPSPHVGAPGLPPPTPLAACRQHSRSDQFFNNILSWLFVGSLFRFCDASVPRHQCIWVILANGPGAASRRNQASPESRVGYG